MATQQNMISSHGYVFSNHLMQNWLNCSNVEKNNIPHNSLVAGLYKAPTLHSTWRFILFYFIIFFPWRGWGGNRRSLSVSRKMMIYIGFRSMLWIKFSKEECLCHYLDYVFKGVPQLFSTIFFLQNHIIINSMRV